jgi:predicted Zn finger-like uncharacterized protein
MTPTMLISCPECKTKIRAPESAIGKKIRCKACEHVFAVKPPNKPSEITATPPSKPAAEKKKAEPKGKAPPPPKEEKPPLKPVPDEDEGNDDDGNPYDVTTLDETYRCPQCAAEMDGPEAIICLNCGFNVRTRTIVMQRRIKDITGEDKFWWLLPGILCALAVVLLITYYLIHTFVLPSSIWDTWDDLSERMSRTKVLADDSITGWYCFLFHPGFLGLFGLLLAFICWKLGKFAFERLVLHPTPPEREVED